jgi:hypothetical protein
VIDDPKDPDNRRTVGEASTSSARRRDGWFEIRSNAEFDAGGLLKGTLFATRTGMSLTIDSLYLVDQSGNLRSFDFNVSSRDSSERLINIHGDAERGKMYIVSRGPVPLLNRRWPPLEYEPRSVVQNALAPIDRLPGLHVGQKWETRVVNPFTGQVDRARVEVTRRTLIHWNGKPVQTFEIVQHVAPLSLRTWVTLDGLILRQEVPVPFVRVVFERRPDDMMSTTNQSAVPPP